MARPRSITDDTLLDGALAVMRRGGPDAMTFAAVAAQTGLSGSTLVQRFGSKQRLLQAALIRAWDLLDQRTAASLDQAPMTRQGAVDLLVALSRNFGAGDDYADGLLVLREDLRDPELRRRGAQWLGTLSEALGRRLVDGSGPRPDLGRLMVAQWQGAVLCWGFTQAEPLPEAVAEALRTWCLLVGRRS